MFLEVYSLFQTPEKIGWHTVERERAQKQQNCMKFLARPLGSIWPQL